MQGGREARKGEIFWLARDPEASGGRSASGPKVSRVPPHFMPEHPEALGTRKARKLRPPIHLQIVAIRNGSFVEGIGVASISIRAAGRVGARWLAAWLASGSFIL